jgi:hypothetical protein
MGSLLESHLDLGWSTLSDFAGIPATTSGGDSVSIVVEDVAILTDPYETANAKTPVYANVYAKAADLALNTARTVTRFTSADGREFKVLEFMEKAEMPTVRQWLCEAKRS